MSTKILIVDDDGAFRTSLQKVLQLQDYSVDTAADGRQAFARITSGEYAAILLDLHLPDLEGIEIAEFIIANDPNCIVIILTGQASVDTAIRALQIGCHDYLVKPCSSDQIVRIIERVIETRKLKRNLVTTISKYQHLAEATWESIAVLSENRILEVNSQFCKTFMTEEAGCHNRPIEDFLPTVNMYDWQHGADESGSRGIETEGLRSDGQTFPVEVRGKYMGEQNPPLLLFAVRDLSERYQGVKDRAKLEERLRYAMRMESIGLMAGKVAHDLNNILSAVVTFPELLMLDVPANGKLRNDLQRIKTAGQQAADVVADLLTVARGSTTQQKVLNLNTLLTDYLESLDFLNLNKQAKEISITSYLAPELATTSISASHVLNCISNLVKNGIEAIDGPGAIHLATNNRILANTHRGYEEIPAGEYAVLTVKDSGQGISADHLPRIFDPFYSKKEMGKSGTGLGLTVIMHTMRDHNGFIDVTSSARGTAFELYFPIDHQRVSKKPQINSLDRLLGNGERLLIIDDEEAQRLLATSVLRRLGYVAQSVATGEQAIALLKNSTFDLLVLDLILEPGLSGYDTYRKILQFVPDQKAIVTSGYHTHPDLQKFSTLGVSRYLGKPLSVASLAQAVQEMLHPPATDPPQ